MAHSIEFNGVDMSAYGLRVTLPGVNLLRQLTSHVQLPDRGYAFRPMREPRYIVVECIVTGTSLANLDVNLDAIKRVLTHIEPKKLIFDALATRYFNAVLESFEGEYLLATSFKGVISFICPDPLGYGIDPEISHNHDIDTAPSTTVDEVTEGTGYIEPVYTLTAGDVLTTATIKIEHIAGNEELQWIGSLAIGEELEIDVANWMVKKEAVASMATVTGRFPRMLPNTTNQIKVTGFLTNGSLNIKYRNTYL